MYFYTSARPDEQDAVKVNILKEVPGTCHLCNATTSSLESFLYVFFFYKCNFTSLLIITGDTRTLSLFLGLCII